ncbi:translation initiation factor IF-2 isoform X1 [Hypanus sabinus]|uniref:translation initiation factor IF-2 isoform X1 n=1 Tax=Hypanus sabinus TaxID=79690 RepID=UPI0028C3DBD6|nr:translation initiation factor IF-2 isoform X1 [Hypanus sabinus]
MYLNVLSGGGFTSIKAQIYIYIYIYLSVCIWASADLNSPPLRTFAEAEVEGIIGGTGRPGRKLFPLLPSGGRCRCAKGRASGLLGSFSPRAFRLLSPHCSGVVTQKIFTPSRCGTEGPSKTAGISAEEQVCDGRAAGGGGGGRGRQRGKRQAPSPPAGGGPAPGGRRLRQPLRRRAAGAAEAAGEARAADGAPGRAGPGRAPRLPTVPQGRTLPIRSQLQVRSRQRPARLAKRKQRRPGGRGSRRTQRAGRGQRRSR